MVAAEEERFARWLWRSDAEKAWKGRAAVAWMLTLVVNVCIVAFLAPLLGVSLSLAIFLFLQGSFTVAIFPGTRRGLRRLLLLRRWRGARGGLGRVYPLADVEFYMAPEQDVLFIAHKDGLSATAIMVVDKLPVGIRGNMHAFIRAIYSAGIPLFYTLLHAPIPDQELPGLGALSDRARTRLGAMEPSQLADAAWRWGGVWKTRLLLGTRRDAAALPGSAGAGTLEAQVRRDLETLQMAFRTAYPHVRLRRLVGRELEDAVRSTLLLGSSPHFF